MKEKTARIGIIGLGRAGRVHLEAWQLVPGADVVAIADPAGEARTYARSAGYRAYSSADKMLERERLDAVSIVTPPVDHTSATIMSVRNGVHVLCEKPFALNTWDAFRMLQAAQNHRRLLLLATKFRHVPALRAAQDVIRSGRLGEIVSFEISFCSRVDMAARWNADRTLAGGGVIMDNGCHAIDIAAFLFDPVSAVRTTVLKRLQDIEVEDSATIEIRTRSGIVGRADVSWSVNTGRDSYVTVYGADGAIEIGWRSCRMRRGDQGWQEIGGGYDKIDCHRRMFASFVQMLRSNGIGCAPWIDSKDAVACVAAVEAAYRSIDSGTWEWVTAEQPEAEELDAEVGA